MHVTLWIVAALLTVAFLAAGAAKLVTPREKLAPRMPWVEDASDAQVKAIGALEVAGARGLVLPAVTGIAPVLVPLAAVGLVLVMVGAVVVHLRRGDGLAGAAPAIVLGLLAVFVAWGRFGAYAF